MSPRNFIDVPVEACLLHRERIAKWDADESTHINCDRLQFCGEVLDGRQEKFVDEDELDSINFHPRSGFFLCSVQDDSLVK